jgi:hypothetical protein
MEATTSSETPVNFQRTAWRYTSEDRTLHYHRSENLKSYTIDTVITKNVLLYDMIKRDSFGSKYFNVPTNINSWSASSRRQCLLQDRTLNIERNTEPELENQQFLAGNDRI